MKFLIKITLLLSLLFISSPAFVSAAIVPCGHDVDCTLCHLWQLFSNLINFLIFNISLPVAGFLFIVAGVLYLVSGGNEGKVRTAKSIFMNTVIGLVIIFTSWLVVDTLLKTVATGEFSGAWNDFPTCSGEQFPYSEPDPEPSPNFDSEPTNNNPSSEDDAITYNPIDGSSYNPNYCYSGEVYSGPWERCYPRVEGGRYSDASPVLAAPNPGEDYFTSSFNKVSPTVADFNGVIKPNLVKKTQKFFIPPGVESYSISTTVKAAPVAYGGIAFARFGAEPDPPSEEIIQNAIANPGEYEGPYTFEEYLSGDTFIVGRYPMRYNFLTIGENKDDIRGEPISPEDAGWLYVDYYRWSDGDPHRPGFYVSGQKTRLTIYSEEGNDIYGNWHNQTGGDPTAPYSFGD